MTMKHQTKSYRGFVVMLGALGLIAVACSDDDDDSGENVAGNGGSTAGKGGSSGGKGGGSAGKGGSSGGKGGNGGNGGNGGSSAGTAGNAGQGLGGDTGVAGDTSIGGTGDGGVGGTGEGGDVSVGGGGEGGAGGAGEEPIVPDTLDNGTFAAYDAGWSESGDLAAATTKWIHDEEPGLNHYSATAYKVRTFQTVTPLPSGTYKLSAEVQKAATLNEQFLFAKGCKAGLPDEEVTAPTTAANDSTYTLVTLAAIEVSSGSCTVGIYTDGPDGAWTNIDNFVFVKE